MRRQGRLGATTVVTWALALALSACGGGDENTTPAGGGSGGTGSGGTGSGGSGGSGGTPPPAPAPGALARLEMSPAGGMFVDTTERRTLTFRGFDANGVEVAVPADQLSVTNDTGCFPLTRAADGSYEVRADCAASSGTITAQVGTVQSLPAVFYSTQLQPGVLPIPDVNVRSGPVAVDPTAVPGLGARFRAVFTGIATPAPGTLIAGVGVQPISGRVVSTASAATGAADVEVIYELVGPTQLFREALVSASLSAAQSKRAIVAAPGRLTVASARRTRPLGLGGAECKGDDPALAVLSGEFEAKVDPSLDMSLDFILSNGSVSFFRSRASGSLDLSGKAVINLGASVTGGVSCKLSLGYIPIPITGALAPLIAPIVPLEGKVELAAQVSANAFSFGAEYKQHVAAEFGLSYEPVSSPDAPWNTVHTISADEPQFGRNVSFPSQMSLRVKTTAFVGLSSGLALGGALARLEVIEVTAGPEFESKFGGTYDVATDGIYTSEYELKGKAAIGPGEHIQKFMERWLLSPKALDLSAKFEKSFARTALPKLATVDKSSWGAGEPLAFTVELDPKTVNFPVVGYNVSEVRIYRLDYEPESRAVLVASAPATPGQTSFAMQAMAERAGQAQDASDRPTFYAFVVDQALASISGAFPFELGRVRDRRASPLPKFAANGAAAYAIRQGVLSSAGKNFGGAVGAGLAQDAVSGPVQVPLANVRAVSGDAWHATALLDDGSVWQWGWGPNIFVIGGDALFNPLPLPVDGGGGVPMKEVESITSGYGLTAAVRKDGTVWQWGGGFPPRQVPGSVSIVAAAQGGSHLLMLTAQGQVLSVGANDWGQLGLGDFSSRSSATEVPGMSDVVAIAVGGSHSLALKRDGSVWVWGMNVHGQLGIGDVGTFVTAPTQLELSGVTRIGAGERHSQAVVSGTAYVWGSNDNGQSGSCTLNQPTWKPTSVALDVKDVGGGEFSSLFVFRDGRVSFLGNIPGLGADCRLTGTGLLAD